MPRTPVVVTVADFRARFPEFAATDDGHIEFAIEEALLIHSIRKLATLYCAAHVLSFRLTAISGGGGSGGGTTTVTGQLESRQVGPLRETFSTHSGTASGGSGGSSARTFAGRHRVFQQHDIRAAFPESGTAFGAGRHRRDSGGVAWQLP